MAEAGLASLVAVDELRRLNLISGRRSAPTAVAIELTHGCNFRCRHCYMSDLARPDRISTARLLALLEELAELGVLLLTLTGGEPLLRRDWYTVATHARRLGLGLLLLSNGSLVTNEVAERWQSLAVTAEISFYSMDSAVFERITGVSGSFGKTRQGIEHLCTHEVALRLKTPVLTHNLTGIETVAEYAQSIGAEWVADPKVVAIRTGDPGPLQLQVPHHRLDQLRGSEPGCAVAAECRPPTDPSRPLCAAGSDFACITAAGDVLACPALPVVAGNIEQQPFREIWAGSPWLQQLRSIRRADLQLCHSCERFAHCNRCFAKALLEDGDLLGPSAWSCTLPVSP